MTKDDDTFDVGRALDASERALTIHEAGHAVVAHALGANVTSVEVYISSPSPKNGKLGGGETGCEVFADNVKNLAVCVAGHKAELAFAADELSASSMLAAHTEVGDYRKIQELLLHFPEADRLAALVKSFEVADEALKVNEQAVRDIADALFERRYADRARIEGDELIALLERVG